jgi:DNA-directed RNA polymerase subunit alpha
MSTSTFLPTPAIHVKSISKSSTEITLEPLPKGFGHTLGNALRRTLCSSLTGCAVVEAKIDGVLHEYSTLEGVREDILTILLNLRESAFALTGSRDEVSLELFTNQVGPITLGAIQLPHDVEVVNPDHVLAHLTQARDFHMMLKVVRDQGDRVAGKQQLQAITDEGVEERKVGDINTLYLDAIFNPVKRVSYEIKPARVGERTDLDKLIIYLETNGTRTPESAIQEAASIIFQQGLKAILDMEVTATKTETTEEKTVESILLESIDQLELTRSKKCLKAEGIYFIGDLITKTRDDLLLTPKLGKRSLEEIEMALAAQSLSLGTTVPNWPPAGLNYPTEEIEEEVRGE